MSIQASCFHCQHDNLFDDKWAGRVMRCQKCGGIVTVPKPQVPLTAPKLADVAQERAAAQQTVGVHAGAWPVAAPPAAKGLAEEARVRVSLNEAALAGANGNTNGARNGNGRHAAAAEKQSDAGKSGWTLAIALCTANGLVLLATAATAIMVAMRSTREMVLSKLHATMPASGTNVAWAVAGFAVLLGAFYLVCAAFMEKGSKFARAATFVAMFQTALQVAMLIYMTTKGQLTHISLAAVTLSLIILCATVDL
ncbi:MAG TPA: hypothetical protein VHM90_06950, partial [Phycisphaerae bacterium]|nr:hypothetical protein [Phycisphaerae bacterium]